MSSFVIPVNNYAAFRFWPLYATKGISSLTHTLNVKTLKSQFPSYVFISCFFWVACMYDSLTYELRNVNSKLNIFSNGGKYAI